MEATPSNQNLVTGCLLFEELAQPLVKTKEKLVLQDSSLNRLSYRTEKEGGIFSPSSFCGFIPPRSG